MNTFHVYTDTSVYGGVFDDEFAVASEAFFGLVRAGRFVLLASDIVRQEMRFAPPHVQTYFQELLAFMRTVKLDKRVLALRDAYLSAGIVAAKSAEDAAHVAAATVGGADLIVSWNFRHIVHFEKIRLYNEVNTAQGLAPIDIRSPQEVIDYEDEVI